MKPNENNVERIEEYKRGNPCETHHSVKASGGYCPICLLNERDTLSKEVTELNEHVLELKDQVRIHIGYIASIGKDRVVSQPDIDGWRIAYQAIFDRNTALEAQVAEARAELRRYEELDKYHDKCRELSDKAIDDMQSRLKEEYDDMVVEAGCGELLEDGKYTDGLFRAIDKLRAAFPEVLS